MQTKHLAPNTASAPGSNKFRRFLLAIGILVIAGGLVFVINGPPVRAPSSLPAMSILQTDGLDAEDIPEGPARSIVPSDTSNMDAASQGILNYIRVRDAVPDFVILGYYRSKLLGPY